MKIIKQFTLSSASTNCYLIEHKGKIILIDAPNNIEVVVNYLLENNLKLDEIYITHTHYDHIFGLNYLVENNLISSQNIYCPKNEIFALKDPSGKGNLSIHSSNGKFVYKYGEVNNFDNLNDDEIEIKYITGHSLQSAIITFKKDNIIFSGDVILEEKLQKKFFIFIEGITPTNFYTNIKEKVLSYPNNFLVYPGHLDMKKVEELKKESRFN